MLSSTSSTISSVSALGSARPRRSSTIVVASDFRTVEGWDLRFADPGVEGAYREIGRERTQRLLLSAWLWFNLLFVLHLAACLWIEKWDYGRLPTGVWVLFVGRLITLIIFQIPLALWRFSHVLSPEFIECVFYVGSVLVLFSVAGLQSYWRVGVVFHGDAYFLYELYSGSEEDWEFDPRMRPKCATDAAIFACFCAVSVFYSRVPLVRASRAWIHLIVVYCLFACLPVCQYAGLNASPETIWTLSLVAIIIAFCYRSVAKSLYYTEERDRDAWASRQKVEEAAMELVEADLARRAEHLASVTEMHERGLIDALENAIEMDQTDAIVKARQAMLEEQWTPLDLDAKEARIRKEQSEARGVLLSYLLSTEFEDLALKASGLEDPNFHDLVQPFFLGPSAIGRDKICPRDGRRGCSLVDSLPCEYRKRCTHFLSWTWSSRLSVVREALRRWAHRSSSNPAEVSFFMCFFVNNQYRILVPGAGSAGSDTLGETFERNLLRTNRMVAVLETFDRPTYLTRIWTIFEQFTAMRLGVEVEVALPSLSRDALIAEFERGKDGIMRVSDAMSTVDSSGARASDPADELKVKNAIRSTVGFKEVDEAIKRVMCEWVHKELRTHMDRIMRDVAPQSTPHPCPRCAMSRAWNSETPASVDRGSSGFFI